MNLPPPIANYPLLHRVASDQARILDRAISYLEVGVSSGGSAEAVLSTNLVSSAILIDPWGTGYGGLGLGPSFVAERLAQFASRVVMITGRSQDILPKLTAKFDMVYLDGDHSAVGALADLNEGLRLLAPSGVIMFDDVDHPAHTYLRKLVQNFADNNHLHLDFHAVHTGMAEMCRKG